MHSAVRRRIIRIKYAITVIIIRAWRINNAENIERKKKSCFAAFVRQWNKILFLMPGPPHGRQNSNSELETRTFFIEKFKNNTSFVFLKKKTGVPTAVGSHQKVFVLSLLPWTSITVCGQEGKKKQNTNLQYLFCYLFIELDLVWCGWMFFFF